MTVELSFTDDGSVTDWQRLKISHEDAKTQRILRKEEEKRREEVIWFWRMENELIRLIRLMGLIHAQ